MKREVKYENQFFVIIAMLVFLMSSCAGTKIAREEKVDIVVTRARSYINTPYKYGGTTTLGMDCSGLLMRSFEAIDTYIPRTA
ncbi:MAG: C40 family peptidase, partial [Cyclobacteriaceae bacterium]|nr:C40 family peptidase [Cyclobacteriaceae bacterium]